MEVVTNFIKERLKMIDNHNTVLEAKAFLNKNARLGVSCPCCNGLVKVYKRKLNTGMALFLISLYKIQFGKVHLGSSEVITEVHAKDVLKGLNTHTKSLDYSVLKHFGLIDSVKGENSEGKKSSGFWTLTTSGIQFVLGSYLAPAYVEIYNNKRLNDSDERVGIEEALGRNFDYEELMNA